MKIFSEQKFTDDRGRVVLRMTEQLPPCIPHPEIRYVSGATISKTNAAGQTMSKTILVTIKADSIEDAFEKLDAACQLAVRQSMLLDGATDGVMNRKGMLAPA